MKNIQVLCKAAMLLAAIAAFTGCGTIHDSMSGRSGHSLPLSLKAGNREAMGASYELHSKSSGGFRLNGTLPADGRSEIVNIPKRGVGEFEVVVTKPGYLPASQSGKVHFSGGGTAALVLDGAAAVVFPPLIFGGIYDVANGTGKKLNINEMNFLLVPEQQSVSAAPAVSQAPVQQPPPPQVRTEYIRERVPITTFTGP